MVTTRTYTVTGMTCSHCVDSVGSEVQQLPRVTDVPVDLASGSVTVTSEQPLDDAVAGRPVPAAGQPATQPTATAPSPGAPTPIPSGHGGPGHAHG
jgi:copper chaperone